jgi:hypothetical protein
MERCALQIENKCVWVVIPWIVWEFLSLGGNDLNLPFSKEVRLVCNRHPGLTKHCGSDISTPASYFGGYVLFEYQFRNQPSWNFMVSLSLSLQILRLLSYSPQPLPSISFSRYQSQTSFPFVRFEVLMAVKMTLYFWAVMPHTHTHTHTKTLQLG